MRAAIIIVLLAIGLALAFLLQIGDGAGPVPGGDSLPGSESPPEGGSIDEGVDAERVEVPVQPAPGELPPDATVSGRIIDAASGGSLAGAKVWLEGAPSMPVTGGLVATTEGDGGYFLPLLRSEVRGLAVGARRDGYLAVLRTLVGADLGTDGHAQDVDLALWPLESTARITGRIVSSDGSAVTASVVTLREQVDPTRSPEDGDPFYLEVRVDGSGAFELAPLPPGTHDLEVQCEGFKPALIPGVRLPRGGMRDVGTHVLSPGTPSLSSGER